VDTGLWLRPVQYERKARPEGNAGIKVKIQKAKFKKRLDAGLVDKRGKRIKRLESRIKTGAF
jgi:hypothetical protein